VLVPLLLPLLPVLLPVLLLPPGAHLGKGLGRMFLRHLRRTRLLLQVVDASAEDPATDYLAVREELRMYNPDYVLRPHVVALNKMDLEDAGGTVKRGRCWDWWGRGGGETSNNVWD